MYKRLLASQLQSSSKSVLLIGPRQTGKSTLIQNLKPDLEINLAHEQTFLDFAQNPLELESRIKNKKTIFIDEIQKLPRLTNTIQSILDKDKKIRIYMTGSSARKLKRKQANLLPGRILTYHLGALTYKELGKDFDLQKALSTGLLPGIYTEQNQKQQKQLAAEYAGVYLKEEVAAEGFVKNLEGFARFLYHLAAHVGQIIDLSKVSSKAQVARPSATRFFEILEDTMIIKKCPPFSHSERTRLVQHPKFYFFDNGIGNGLLKNFRVSEDRIGAAFETFIFNQLTDVLNARGEIFRLTFYRTEHGAEVDLILEVEGRVTAIEIKASSQIGEQDLKGFQSFKNYYARPVSRYVLYLGDQPKELNGVHIRPWQIGLDEILG